MEMTNSSYYYGDKYIWETKLLRKLDFYRDGNSDKRELNGYKIEFKYNELGHRVYFHKNGYYVAFYVDFLNQQNINKEDIFYLIEQKHGTSNTSKES